MYNITMEITFHIPEFARKAPVTPERRTAGALKKWQFWPVRRRSLGVRHHALLVRRARWTNAVHSSPFVVCVGVFVHAQNCARRSTRECTRQKDASHAQSALDQRPTHAGHTRDTRRACVVCSSTEVQRTPSAPWAHTQRASNACPARRAFFWRVPSVCVACTQRVAMG